VWYKQIVGELHKATQRPTPDWAIYNNKNFKNQEKKSNFTCPSNLVNIKLLLISWPISTTIPWLYSEALGSFIVADINHKDFLATSSIEALIYNFTVRIPGYLRLIVNS